MTVTGHDRIKWNETRPNVTLPNINPTTTGIKSSPGARSE